MRGTIAALHSYPIKSAGGIELAHAGIGRAGFEFDRNWMLVDHSNRFVSQRKISEMALLSTAISEATLRIEYPEMPELSLPLNGPTKGEPFPATMHRSDESIMVEEPGDESSAWFSRALGSELRFVRIAAGFIRRIPDHPESQIDQVALADGYPYLITSTASLARLNDRLLEYDTMMEPLEMIRFRPNIVLDLDEPWIEMSPNMMLIVPEQPVEFKLDKPCQRCGIPQVNPRTGISDVGPELHKILKELCAELERPVNCFGQNAIPRKGVGETLQVGMEIELVSAS